MPGLREEPAAVCSNASSGLLCNQRDFNLITSVIWVSISGTTIVMEGVAGRVLRRLGQGRVRVSVHFWHHMKQNTSLRGLFSKGGGAFLNY